MTSSAPVKRLLARMKRAPARAGEDAGAFSSMFPDASDAAPPVAAWRERAVRVGAAAFDHRQGVQAFVRLWGTDRNLVTLGADELERMSQYIEFVRVPAGQEVIGQDERGDYMLIVLDGALSVDRGQPRGGKARLAEARAGDMLGEMSLLDAGARFSSCVTLAPCTLAVVEAKRLDDMIARDPRLAVALLASLSRRLSLRLRQVSSRLTALLSQN